MKVAFAVVLAALLAVSNAQFGSSCRQLFTSRRDLSSQPENVLLINQIIDAANCCKRDRNGQFSTWNYNVNNKKTPCSTTTGPVCGWNFETYANECQACEVGVQFLGACKPAVPNVIQCYLVADFTQRLQCYFAALGNVITNVNLNAYQPMVNEIAKVAPCTPATLRFRQADGSCNNPTALRYSGMAGLPFVRHNRSPLPQDLAAALANGPNPRAVSNALFKRTTFKPNRIGLNGLAFAWLNFFVHDFFLHENDWQEIIAVPIPNDDPVWPAQSYWDPVDRYMYIPRSLAAVDSFDGARFLRNKVTAWFDGSQVYGSDQSTANRLRTFSGGLLKTGAGNLAPDAARLSFRDTRTGQSPLFDFGDMRGNQHAGISAMQILFVREHNNIATRLAAAYPTLTDDELYGFARLIVAAELVKIQTIEMSTQLVDDPAQQVVLQSIWSQLGTSAVTYNPLGTHHTPEDFVAAYKWHAMVPEKLQLRNPNGSPVGTPIDYLSTFHDTSVVRTNGIDKVLVGLGATPAGWVTLNNHPDSVRDIRHATLNYRRTQPFEYDTCQIVPGFDLGTADIVRDRERGVPKYNAYTRILSGGLPAAQNFAQLASDGPTALKLARLYNWDIESVDFTVGLLGSDTHPTDGLPQASTVGFLPFVLARSRLDRFYTSHFNAGNYTQVGFERVRGNAANPNGVTMAQIFAENGVTTTFPGTAAQKIFKTWVF